MGERREERGEMNMKVVFWNVAGLENKDKDFWEGLREWDMTGLSETWVERERWNRIEIKLPKGYVWGMRKAIRSSRKGRAKGGMVMGIKKELIELGRRIETDREGMLIGRVKWEKKYGG